MKAERGAAPAGEARNLALGRPRDPARRPLRAGCEELAARSTAQMPRTETRPRGLKSPQVERREASVPIARDAGSPRKRSRHAAHVELVGQLGRVTRRLDPSGEVHAAGEFWSATLPAGETAEAGETVRITGSAGLTLHVERIDQREGQPQWPS